MAEHKSSSQKKMSGFAGLNKTREKVTQAINQAKESLKVLETLEKETLAKAKSFVKIPSAAERKRLTNDRILSSLRKLGVATQSEVEALEQKLHKIESSLHSSRKSAQ